MWLIDRQGDGLSPTRISLPSPLKAALVRWYVGRGSRQDEEAGITLVQQARVGQKWLACDCRGIGKRPPILTPAFLSEAETYYLRRLTGDNRPEHQSDCPFFRDQVTNRNSEIGGLRAAADAPIGFFEVLKPAPENLAQRPDDDGNDDRTRSASIPRLARLLWRLMSISGVNSLPPLMAESRDSSISEEFRALTGAAAKIEIAPGIELARAFWTHGKALHSRRAYACIRQLAQRWPSDHAPQGFLALFANEFRGATVYAADCEPIEIANRVQSPSTRHNAVKGPYLVLIVVGQYPDMKGFAPLRAYAQPIYSGNRFLPISSELDRRVIREMLKVRNALHRQAIELVIEKPMFDRLTPAGSCRPSFVVEAISRQTGEIRQFVLDVAASRDDHPAIRRCLEEVAPVVRISREDVDDGKIGTLLLEAVFARR